MFILGILLYVQEVVRALVFGQLKKELFGGFPYPFYIVSYYIK